MRVLLDTNILIHREAGHVVSSEIGPLFRWLDRLHFDKCIHPLSVQEIRGHADSRVVQSFLRKLASYHELRTTAPDLPAIASLRASDRSTNDAIDTSLLAELAAGRVDLIITEDSGIHRKAAQIGLAEKTLTIESFLERATAEHPDQVDYRVLGIRRQLLGALRLDDHFFDSFRDDYQGFNQWFNRKADEEAYVAHDDANQLVAFLYLKAEDAREVYSDIQPVFKPARRLKIGTLKVTANGFKLGERFIKIVFDNALAQRVDEIYVTIFRKRPEQERLVRQLEEWGFVEHGVKNSASGTEHVYVRAFDPSAATNSVRRCYPFVSARTSKFIVPIYPQYHTELFPDSILRTESPADFVESKPNRNAIAKVYISRSHERQLSRGDVIVFYRTAQGGPAHYTSVATTLGVVESMNDDIPNLETFVSLCRKRSVFTDSELAAHWNYSPNNRPFVVGFLHVHSFPRRPNLAKLKEEGIIEDAPRGFAPLTDRAFTTLLEISNAEKRLVVN